MISLLPQAFAAPANSGSGSGSVLGVVLAIVLMAWYVIVIVQAIMGYGTAYRKTKANGDNGVSLFGWMIVYCSLAALVPGLGIYLWNKSKQTAMPPMSQPPQYPPTQQPMGQNPAGQYNQGMPPANQFNQGMPPANQNHQNNGANSGQ